MRSGNFTDSGADRHLSKITNYDLSDTDVRMLKLSSEYYERRSKILGRLRKGDWWIAIGIYLVLAGLAIAVL